MNTNLKHVAIIMDGNGRWAQNRHHPRVWGHVRGSKIVSDIVEAADDYGLKALTLYAFSTENWSRPLPEINSLFSLLKKFLNKERKRIIENNIKFRVMGEISGLPESTIKLIKDLEEETKSNTGLKLSFAFGYGSRCEILKSINKYIIENPGKEISEEDLNNNLYLSDLGDVDLLIRTGGDQRVSNFLLWQIAYAELFFTETKWPDFKPKEFVSILDSVSKRERRFGTVSNDLSLDDAVVIASKQKKSFINHLGL